MAIVTLLDWCSANGISIHPNLRIIHHEKMGICVRAASDPIMSDQSRKRFSPTLFFLNIQRDIRCCFPTRTIDHYYLYAFLRGCQLS
jgi:hypothetical protein